jgi:hypothetical protein
MMIAMRRLFLVALIWSAAGFAPPVQTAAWAAPRIAAQPATAQPATTAALVRIDLFRGLADIFSRGMDTLTVKLQRHGYSAAVYSTNGWQAVARQIAARYSHGQKDIVVLVGHSLGADATIQIANELDRLGIPIELIVTFDATRPHLVPRNVLHFVNFYQDNGFGKRITAGPGFHGELSNIDLTADTSLSHITIDKSDRLHSYVLGKIGFIVEKDLAKRLKASKPQKKKPAKRG